MGPRELYQRGLVMSALQATRWELVGLGFGDGVWRFRRGVVTRAIMAGSLREAIGLLLVQEGCLDPGDVTEAETPPDRRIMGGKPPPPRRPAAVGSRLDPGHKRDRGYGECAPDHDAEERAMTSCGSRAAPERSCQAPKGVCNTLLRRLDP